VVSGADVSGSSVVVSGTELSVSSGVGTDSVSSVAEVSDEVLLSAFPLSELSELSVTEEVSVVSLLYSSLAIIEFSLSISADLLLLSQRRIIHRTVGTIISNATTVRIRCLKNLTLPKYKHTTPHIDIYVIMIQYSTGFVKRSGIIFTFLSIFLDDCMTIKKK
jgi:hypothetical protein